MGEICALFPLAYNNDILYWQDKIREAFGVIGIQAEYVKPEDLHITAVYVGEGEFDRLAIFDPLILPAFSTLIDGVGVFDTPDGYAIHLTVRNNGELSSMQAFLFGQLENGTASSFSIPENYTPHITLAYSSIPVTPFTIKPFAVAIDRLVFSDEDHLPILVTEMKSIELDNPILKSADIEVEEKGVRFNDEGDLIIPIIGIPFKGPVDGVRDLAGDFFHKGTDVGPLEEVMVFYDHGRDQRYIQTELKAIGLSDDEIKELGDFGFGKRDIGVARKGLTTADGIMYEIIVRRNTQYKNALYKAAKGGFLAGSSGSKAFEYDKSVTGKVDYAAVVEITLTPSPFNIEAAIVDKATKLEEDEVATKAKAEVKDEKPPVEQPANEPEQETEGEVDKSTSTSPIADALKAKKAAIEAEKSVEGEEAEETVESEVITSLRAELAEARAEIAAVAKSLSDFRTDMVQSLPDLGELIAESLAVTMEKSVNDFMMKSRLEKSADTILNGGFKNKSVSGKQNSASQAPVVQHNASRSMSNYPGSN